MKKPTTILYSAAGAQQKALRWSSHRASIRRSKERERAVRRARKARLVEAAAECAEERKAVTRGCAVRRQHVRLEATTALEKEQSERLAQWESYRFRVGSKGMPKGGKMSAAENDSLAEHSIDPELVSVWRKVRRQFPTKLAPDHRVELFNEWVQEHPSEVSEIQAKAAEPMDWAQLQAEHYREQLEESVPF